MHNISNEHAPLSSNNNERLLSRDGITQILCKQLKIEKLFIVHRLDIATSGCLLLAKSSQSASVLSLLFQNRSISKLYVALSDKKPTKKQGTVKGDIEKTRGGSYRLTRGSNNQAITKFTSVTANNLYPDASSALRLYLLKPITGKTHQLRVTLKSLGSPIIGDERYKGTQADRLYLHSYSLSFDYRGEKFSYTCLPQSGNMFCRSEFVSLFNEHLSNSFGSR
jgi:tRNA pseudouridine32 synthase/23S rRNA pseudouridine746 synthase